MKTRETYRQGDVLIRRVDEIPTGLEAVPRDDGRLVLAYGEATGHAHVVEGPAELFREDDRDELERRFLRVEAEAGQALVVHDEHDAIELPPGDYEVVGQREYTPEEIRRVAD